MRITLSRLAGTACLVFALTQPIYAQEMPQRGASKAAVEQRFGTPLTKHSPVGTPPITRWDYQDYSVYFEGNTALHSVSHSEGVVRRSQQPQANESSADANITRHGTVLELPAIEETEETLSESTTEEAHSQPQQEQEPELEQEPEQNDADGEEEWDGGFRFDPATGRIVPTSGSESRDTDTNDQSATSATSANDDEALAEDEAEDQDTFSEDQAAAQDNAQEDSPAEAEAADHSNEEAADTEASDTADTEKAEDVIEESHPQEAPAEQKTAEDDDSGGFQMNW